MKEVHVFEFYMSYEWEAIGIGYDSETKKWSITTQTGCSCTCWEGIDLEAEQLEYSDFLPKAHRFISESIYADSAEKAEAHSELSKLRFRVENSECQK